MLAVVPGVVEAPIEAVASEQDRASRRHDVDDTEPLGIDDTTTFSPIPVPRIIPTVLCTLGEALFIFIILLVYGSAPKSPLPWLFLAIACALEPAAKNAVTFLVTAPIVVCGQYKHRFHIPWVVTATTAAAISGTQLGLSAVMLVAFMVGFFAGAGPVNAFTFANAAHKDLDRNFGPPLVFVIVAFCFILYGYTSLVSWSRTWVVGLLLPVATLSMQVLMMSLLRRCYWNFYIRPKLAYVESWSQGGADEAGKITVLPIYGQTEVAFGILIATCALIVDSTKLIACTAEVIGDSSSLSWISGFASSFLWDTASRMGLAQQWCTRFEGVCRKRRFVRLSDFLAWCAYLDRVDEAYLAAHYATGYAGVILLTACSFARAVLAKDSSMILFGDVSPIVPVLLVLEFASEVIKDAIVYLGERRHVVPRVTIVENGHVGAGERSLSYAGIVTVVVQGGGVILMILAIFLGPRFLAGVCPHFNPSPTGVWFASDAC